MGAFGPGMQDNDTALDEICKYVRYVANGEPVLHGPLPPVTEMFEGLDDAWAILGLADWLLDQGIDLSPVRDVIAEALKVERRKRSIGTWTRPRERRAALAAFERRVDGLPPEVPDSVQRLFVFGSADDLDERVRDEEGRPHGGDPVAVCVRVCGNTPERGAARIIELLKDALEGDPPRLEEVSDGHVRIVVFENRATGEYVNVYLNVNNLDAERDDVPAESEELEAEDAGPEA